MGKPQFYSLKPTYHIDLRVYNWKLGRPGILRMDWGKPVKFGVELVLQNLPWKWPLSPVAEVVRKVNLNRSKTR